MDWFEAITGFRELHYEETKSELSVEGGCLVSRHSTQRRRIGRFATPSLGDLRATTGTGPPGSITVRNVVGDARRLHSASSYRGAVFQVASQFNMLEMIGPDITPEHGVTRYLSDRTQGPACAIAAGAATIYRNYLVPVGNQLGQTANVQINGLWGIAIALAARIGEYPERLIPMRNGYALPDRLRLERISSAIEAIDDAERDALRSLLQVGWHQDVEVTDVNEGEPRLVSQVFCSALPVAYSGVDAAIWEPFARLVLEAAYEATMLCALQNAERGASNQVLLTRLGGGAFGNPDDWIDEAMLRALNLFRETDLEVHLVSYGSAPPSMIAIAERFERRSGFD